ncbi:MAG TPA: HEAT repeat domain-containing protein, partial [Polyangiaceae bacterium]|nr:HEAT repeat domain-containing protein [Polyangiaceae bacterium]
RRPVSVERLLDKHLSEAERVAAAGAVGDLIARERPLDAAWKAACTVAHDEKDPALVRVAALGAIARAPAAAINQLVRIFRDPERLVRREAVRLLRAIGFAGDEKRLQSELDAVGASKPIALYNLALSFGHDARVIAAYRDAATKSEPSVRALALSGLAQLGEMADVVRGLQDSDPDVRVAAAEALGDFGTLEQEEIAALNAAQNDSDSRVAKAVRTALKRLGAIPRPQPGRAAKPKSTGPEGKLRKLLSSLSKAALADPDYAATLDDEVVESGWLGFPGASDEELAELSRRLGAPLPPSYETFLRVTNGFGRISSFIDKVWSAAEVRPFRVDNSEWIAVYADSQQSPISVDEHQRYGDDQDCAVFDARYLANAIQISEVGDGVLLLNPAVRTPDGEWEAWFFANWLPGAERYRSFLELLQGLTADSRQ